MQLIDYDALLDRYRQIWNNRRLQSENDSETVLKEAMTRELLDENSHPRIRRPLYEKYYMAVKRIIDSSLPDRDKLLLITIHAELVENLKK